MVENNSKFVRGKKRSIENIESYVFYYYDMKKLIVSLWIDFMPTYRLPKLGEFRATFFGKSKKVKNKSIRY